ncbi:hypothetical protein SAMN05216174_113148 [Actinokineospora iranica]|uniref:PD-(D/E)XK nuclease-like domain-containing protein n=2 Tax=Actinokineospora iranica TaxID=1271860 RepID=A0A1G6VZ80_9PSEU|nr:hypothetical protein SAMN05216174_113148 [Actinokineospora iranica]
MSAAARTYATARLDVIKAAGGMAESGRLWRNMLSSQPLAFSIVGEFRAHERAALSVLERLTRLDLVEFGHLDSGKPAAIDPWVLNGLQAEWAPPMRQHTGDRSGFDMAAVVRTKAGDRVLVTVEVKYVDSFSPQKLDIPKYASHLEEAGIAEADANDLVNLGASQFLRSLLLTNSVRQRGLRGDSHFDQALAVILCRADDQRAHKVVEAVGQACSAPGLTVGMWSHEQLLSKAAAEPALHEWAQSMQRRYVLGP